jgi:hypothetical protein
MPTNPTKQQPQPAPAPTTPEAQLTAALAAEYATARAWRDLTKTSLFQTWAKKVAVSRRLTAQVPAAMGALRDRDDAVAKRDKATAVAHAAVRKVRGQRLAAKRAKAKTDKLRANMVRQQERLAKAQERLAATIAEATIAEAV